MYCQYIGLCIVFLFLMEGIGGLGIDILLLEFCSFMMLTLVYFIRALMRFNEPTAVIAAFTMFTGVLAISIINSIVPHLLHADYGHWLGTLTEVISLLVAFRSFFIKAPEVSFPFKLFGMGVGLIVLPRLIVQLVAMKFNVEALISITGDLGVLIVLLATAFILKRMMVFLGNEVEPPVDAADQV